MESSVWIFLLNYCFLYSYLTSNILVASNGLTNPSIISTCDDFGICSQKCDMVDGQPNCSCVDMFQLNNDNKTCTPNDPERLLIFVERSIIFSLRGNTYDFAFPRQRKPILNMTEECFQSVTSDVRNNYVYGTNLGGNFNGIFRINVNHTGEPAILVDAGTSQPTGISFDWITGNVYFVDKSLKYIAVCAPLVNQCAKVLDDANEGPFSEITDIALHPNAGLDTIWLNRIRFVFTTAFGILLLIDCSIMFWTDRKAIRKAGMDGSNPIIIVSTNLITPYGITVDVPNSRLYWVDADKEIIETARLDGSDRRTISSSLYPIGIDVFGDTVYWTDWSDNEINIVDKFGGNKSKISTEIGPRGLTIMHISKQPKLRVNHCDSLSCSHICALSPTTAHCFCPVGMIKNANLCMEDEESPKLLVAYQNTLLVTQMHAVGRDVFEEVRLPPQIKAINALVYNPINKSVIISDDISKKIVEYRMQSQEYQILVERDLMNVTCLEMDAIGENLFWYDAGKLTLEVMSMKTRSRAILIRNFESIHDILFVRDLGALYISQMETYKNIRKIVFTQGQLVNETAIDQFQNYWAPVQLVYDQQQKEVHGVFWKKGNAFTQNQNSGKKFHSPSDYVTDAVQVNNEIFWVDLSDKVKIYTDMGVYPSSVETIKINFDTFRSSSVESRSSRKFIAAVNTDTGSLEQLRSNHPCSPVNSNRKMCSHICLATENTRVGVCWCPTHLKLGVDGLTCFEQENGKGTSEKDLSPGEDEIESHSTNTTDTFVVINSSKEIFNSKESGNGSNSSIWVYVTVLTCLIVGTIVVIYLIMKRKENGVSLFSRTFRSNDVVELEMYHLNGDDT